MISAHAMHSSTGRSGGGTNVNIARRGGVMPPRRSKQELTNVHDAASNIPSYEVSVHALKVGGRKHSPRQDAFAEAGSETLDLILESLKQVYLEPIRHMAISPSRVFACWSPCAIEKTRLGQQNERTIGDLSDPDCSFRGSNLFETSAKMHRRRSQALGGFPGNRRVQRVIHFEDGGAIAEFCHSPLVAVRESFSSNVDELSRSQVAQKHVIFRKYVRQCRETLDRR